MQHGGDHTARACRECRAELHQPSVDRGYQIIAPQPPHLTQLHRRRRAVKDGGAIGQRAAPYVRYATRPTGRERV